MNIKFNQSVIFKCAGVVATAALFSGLNTLLDCTGINSKSRESKKLMPNVSICFDFDARLKERPIHVFLKKKDEWEKVEKIDPKRVQLYEAGKDIYDFYNIEPGIYWVGFSFNYLLKQKIKNKEVIEWIYVDPGRSIESGESTENKIEVKNNNRVLVDLKIQLRLMSRPESSKKDPQEYSLIIPRTRPKSPEEKLMLDENYFLLGAAGFENVERSSFKFINRSKILFSLYVFDDYPFEQQQTQED